MAKLYGEIASSALMTFDKSFARANGQPLDSTEVYYSLAAAEEYAAGAGAYIGQKIVVIENGVITHYSIEDAEGTLKELGSKPVGDGLTITITDDGKISLANIPEVEKDDEGKDISATYNAVLVNGKLTWVKPSATTVEGLSDLIEALTVRVDTTEADIDGLQEAVGVKAEGETPATGLFKAIADEIARATAAEGELDARIDAIDYVDEDELATALEPYATKQHVADEIAKVEIPVIGVSAEDSILALGADKLISASVALAYDADAKLIKLTGKDGADLGSVDATPFIKDGMLNDVTYDATTNTLTFKWNTAAGISEDTVVLSDIIEPYTAGNGINIESNEISVKVADGSETFLSVDENGVKLSGVQTAIDAAKSAAISDAEGKIATAKQEAISAAADDVDGKLEQTLLDIAGTYATKEYVGTLPTDATSTTIVDYIEKKAQETLEAAKGDSTETIASLKQQLDDYKSENDPKVSKNAEDITTINEKLKDVEANADVNIIETVKVNGSALTPDSDKAVDITVPTKFSDITDDSGFDARITAAQTQADKGVADAESAYKHAAEALAKAESNEFAIGTLTTTVSGHTESITDYGTRIGVLENFKTSHEAQYSVLSGIVSDHTSDIAKKANQTDLEGAVSRISTNEVAIQTIIDTGIPALNNEIGKKANIDDVYTKATVDSIIGTPTEGKCVVDMIAEAKAEATYDDTEIKADIKKNTDAIAILNSDDQVEGSVDYKVAQEVAKILNDNDPSDIDTLNEIAAWITNDTTGAAKMNADIIANTSAITKLNGSVDTEGSILSMIAANAPKIATTELAGVVKSVLATVENGVTVANDGTMSVNSLNVNRLVQTANEELILNGGSANI